MTAREDLTPEALCLTNSELSRAMRQAWAEIIGGPFTPWRHDIATAWPHPDRAVRDRFHARTNELLYEALHLDPLRKTGEDDRAPRLEVPKGTPGRNRMPLVLSDQQILQRYQEGMTSPDIARLCRVSDETIRRILHRHGVRMRAAATFLSEADRQRLAADYRRGDAVRVLAARYNLRQQRVRLELTTLGVRLRDRSVAQLMRHRRAA